MRINYYRCHSAVVLAAAALFFSSNSSAQTIQGGSPSSKLGFGFRVGLNYAKVNSDADSIQYHYKQGLMIAVFLSPVHKGVIGYKNELLFSRQGFQYADAHGHTGTVSNDYLMLPQMMTINITKYVQLQAGAFAGYLLYSKNSNQSGSSAGGENAYLDLFNRIDYGAAGGIEIRPIKGLVINARYNMGFAKLYKEQSSQPANTFPTMLPFQNIDTKNAVIQFSAGYQF